MAPSQASSETSEAHYSIERAPRTSTAMSLVVLLGSQPSCSIVDQPLLPRACTTKEEDSRQCEKRGNSFSPPRPANATSAHDVAGTP